MTCYNPLKAHQAIEGGPLLFNKPRNIPTREVTPPCGQCIGCRLDRSQQWAMRGINEASLHEKNCMITMTYDDENLPGDLSLTKSHHQNLMRKIRYEFPQAKIRFINAGEYGEPTELNNQIARPHYHTCLFGIDFSDKEVFKNNEGILTYTSEKLEDIWGKGFCTVSDLTYETVAYVARYILKKVTGKKADDHYTTTHPITGEVIEREPEYMTCSLKPGIGSGWYEKYQSDCFPSDFLIYKGKKVKVPKYYDRKLEISDRDQMEMLKNRRKKQAMKRRKDNTPERLAVRQKVKQLTVQRFIKRGL